MEGVDDRCVILMQCINTTGQLYSSPLPLVVCGLDSKL